MDILKTSNLLKEVVTDPKFCMILIGYDPKTGFPLLNDIEMGLEDNIPMYVSKTENHTGSPLKEYSCLEEYLKFKHRILNGDNSAFIPISETLKARYGINCHQYVTHLLDHAMLIIFSLFKESINIAHYLLVGIIFSMIVSDTSLCSMFQAFSPTISPYFFSRLCCIFRSRIDEKLLAPLDHLRMFIYCFFDLQNIIFFKEDNVQELEKWFKDCTFNEYGPSRSSIEIQRDALSQMLMDPKKISVDFLKSSEIDNSGNFFEEIYDKHQKRCQECEGLTPALILHSAKGEAVSMGSSYQVPTALNSISLTCYNVIVIFDALTPEIGRIFHFLPRSSIRCSFE